MFILPTFNHRFSLWLFPSLNFLKHKSSFDFLSSFNFFILIYDHDIEEA